MNIPRAIYYYKRYEHDKRNVTSRKINTIIAITTILKVLLIFMITVNDASNTSNIAHHRRTSRTNVARSNNAHNNRCNNNNAALQVKAPRTQFLSETAFERGAPL
jgi:hypothetical protein